MFPVFTGFCYTLIMSSCFLLRQLIAASLALVDLAFCPSAEAAVQLDKISLPPGFSIEVFATAPGARSISVSAELSTVFAGLKNGAIYAIPYTMARP
jgi:hypothetical protein